MERLQKILAQANVASRRKCEEIILEGRVKVNNVVVKEMGYKVDKSDQILVDDKPISRANHIYILLNKPTGYVTTTSDEKGRKTVLDLISDADKENRLYPVGRLDFDTAGLLILTNDGDLTKHLTHPSFQIEKEYLARVEGIMIRETIKKIRNGILIDNSHLAKAKEVRRLEIDKNALTSLISITLTEGRNKEVRKIMEKVGHPVRKLTRVRYDFLTLEGVERGAYRHLKIHEVKKLYANSR